MQILDFVSDKLNFAMSVLDDLIANYDGMEDAERMEKSNTIFDNLRSYLRIEENLLMPCLERRKNEYTDLLEPIHLVHERINYVLEHAIMIHVDEPNHEYYNRMVQLRKLMEDARRNDQERLFPWLNQYLSESERNDIARQFNTQMNQESLPSSGMTIY